MVQSAAWLITITLAIGALPHQGEVEGVYLWHVLNSTQHQFTSLSGTDTLVRVWIFFSTSLIHQGVNMLVIVLVEVNVHSDKFSKFRQVDLCATKARTKADNMYRISHAVDASSRPFQLMALFL